ncbi:MAG: hypothetical protein ACOCYE_09910, partial [Pseudomonadota bacterium]
MTAIGYALTNGGDVGVGGPDTTVAVRTADVEIGRSAGPGFENMAAIGGRIGVVAPRQGVVSAVEVAPGDRVAAGDAPVRFEQASERAAVTSATAEVELARADLERRLARAEDGLANAAATLDTRTVSAPVAGTVRTIDAELGTLVVAGTPLVDLVNDRLHFARFEVPRLLASAFEPGVDVMVMGEAGRHPGEGLEVRMPQT